MKRRQTRLRQHLPTAAERRFWAQRLTIAQAAEERLLVNRLHSQLRAENRPLGAFAPFARRSFRCNRVPRPSVMACAAPSCRYSRLSQSAKTGHIEVFTSVIECGP